MKITLPNGTILEMPDTPTPVSQAVDTSAPAAVAPEPTPEAKEPAALSTPPVGAEPKPRQSEPVTSTDRTIYGGVSNISDPQAGNPNVFQFQRSSDEK